MIQSLLSQEIAGSHFKMYLTEKTKAEGKKRATYAFEMEDVQYVDAVFYEKIASFVKLISPFVETPFELSIRDCSRLGDDDRYFFYGGPDQKSIDDFKNEILVRRAIGLLDGVQGDLLEVVKRIKKNDPRLFQFIEAAAEAKGVFPKNNASVLK